MSRAACSASVVSAACSEPTCLCARPLRLRMKTSHNCVFGVVITGLPEICGGLGRGLAALAFFGVCLRRLGHPCAFLMRLAARRETIAIAWAIAGQHRIELAPVDRAVFPIASLVLCHA